VLIRTSATSKAEGYFRHDRDSLCPVYEVTFMLPLAYLLYPASTFWRGNDKYLGLD